MISAGKVNKGPKACATCAKAKARCIPGPVDNICERCHRLRKSCSSQTPAPPRKRKEPKPTKVAELERRLEHLTSRLDSVAQVPQPRGKGPQQPSPPDSSPDQESVTVQSPVAHFKGRGTWKGYAPFGHLFPSERPVAVHPTSMHDHPPPLNCVDHLFQSDIERPATLPSAEMDAVLTGQARDQSWPQPEEAEEMLQVFRDISQLFPFVMVPSSATGEQLRHTRPFLWKGAMVVACHLDGVRQIMLGKRLMREITEATFIKPQKSLDLLQGLLLLLAHFHFDMNSFQTTNMLFLARSLAASLGLGGLQPNGADKHAEHTAEALEQMRAYCGVYYLVTLVFTTSKQADSLMSSPHLDACIQILEARAEYPSDSVLVSLLRIQQLAQSISVMFAFRGSGSGGSELPTAIVVKTFQQQLDSYRALLPAHLKHHNSIMGHVHVTEILLYEGALQPLDAPGPFLPPGERLEMLWACLNATRGYMAARFRDPISLKPQSVCIQSFNYMYAFLISLKLMTFQFPGWDPRQVRRELNFDELLERQIQDMLLLAERRRAKSDGAVDGEVAAAARRDPFETLAQRMAVLQAGVLAELDNVATPTATTPTTPGDEEMPSAFGMTQEIIQDLDNWPDLFAFGAPTPGGTERCDGMVHPPPFMDYWATAI